LQPHVGREQLHQPTFVRLLRDERERGGSSEYSLASRSGLSEQMIGTAQSFPESKRAGRFQQLRSLEA
jgi:hypothetical protein